MAILKTLRCQSLVPSLCCVLPPCLWGCCGFSSVLLFSGASVPVSRWSAHLNLPTLNLQPDLHGFSCSWHVHKSRRGWHVKMNTRQTFHLLSTHSSCPAENPLLWIRLQSVSNKDVAFDTGSEMNFSTEALSFILNINKYTSFNQTTIDCYNEIQFC